MSMLVDLLCILCECE